MKWYTIWILIHVIALALLKSSICMIIWRIASVLCGMLMALIFLLALVWASFFVTFNRRAALLLPRRAQMGDPSCT